MSQLEPEEIARRQRLHVIRKAYRRCHYTPDPDGVECCTCKRKLPRGMFSASIVRGRSYRHKRCIRCRASIYLRSATCKEKRALIDSLKDKPCAKCGQKYEPFAMVFVHRREIKKFNVSMAWSGRSKESIIEEAKKCDVICSNCERINRLCSRVRVSKSRSKLAVLPPELSRTVDLRERLDQITKEGLQGAQA